MATFHTRLATAVLAPRSPPVTRTFTNKTRCLIVTAEKRLLDRTEGENSSTGKTKLQRKKSKQREVWKQALRGWEQGVLCPGQRQGRDRGCGAEQTPPWHLGSTTAGNCSSLALRARSSGHQPAGASWAGCVWHQQCGGGGDSFLSPLNPDHSLSLPEHPDCSYTFLINIINGNE